MNLKKILEFNFFVIFVFLVVKDCFPQNSNNSKGTVKDTVLSGVSTHIFTTVNIEDAKAALNLLLSEMINSWGRPDVTSSPKTYENIEKIKKDININRLDIIAMTTSEYFILRDQTRLPPFLAYKSDNITVEKILLVTRTDSKINSVKDLKKKKVTVFSYLDDEFNLPTLWYKTIVLKNNENYKNDYAPFLDEVNKSSRAISDVFFKKSDAVVVSESEFNISKELNPQIGNQLKIIDSSKPLLYGIICYTDRLKTHKNIEMEEIISNFCSMHKSKIGKHFLQMFKITQFIPYKEEYLTNTEELYKEFLELSKRKKK